MLSNRWSLVLFTAILCITTRASLAQNLTGIWRGYFITDQFEQYKFEIQIEQTGSSIQGVSYSYLNTVFYGKAALKGNVESGKRARLRETETLEIKMSDGSHSCIMDCEVAYVRSGREEFLEGTYTSKFEKTAPGVRKGADCGDGKVYLRRVTESDFYLEPFLKNQARNRPVYENQAPIGRNKSTPAPGLSGGLTGGNPIQSSSAPSSKQPQENSRTEQVSLPKRVMEEPTPDILKKRINELTREVLVKNRLVIARIYDNGEIDGDTISVYLGNKLILSKKRLTASALEIRIELPEGQDEQEITLVAENLGTIPPNTSLMIVESGGERQEVRITSTDQKNAVVRFRYRAD